MNSINKSTFLLFPFLLASLIIVLPCKAQTADDPFSYIKLNGSISNSIKETIIDDYWNHQYGLSGNVETPFYLGVIQIGFSYFPFEGNSNRFPDFKTLFTYAGWGYELHLPFNTDLFAGIKVGPTLMSFNDTEISLYNQTESELTLGAAARMNIRIYRSIYISGSVDFITIFTQKEMTFLFVSGGISYSFSTPLWLRSFLN